MAPNSARSQPRPASTASRKHQGRRYARPVQPFRTAEGAGEPHHLEADPFADRAPPHVPASSLPRAAASASADFDDMGPGENGYGKPPDHHAPDQQAAERSQHASKLRRARAANGDCCDLPALERLGLVQGTSGNVSARSGHGLLITPSGVPYDRLLPEDIVMQAWDGSSSGDLQPSSEWRFHRDLLAKRPDLDAVVHTHSTHATAVSILRRDIPAIHYSIAAAGGASIRCAPYALFGSQALADLVVTAMEGRRACLLAHHGVVTAHTRLARAVELAQMVEELAKQYLLCLAVGEPPVLDDAQMAEAIARFATYASSQSEAELGRDKTFFARGPCG